MPSGLIATGAAGAVIYCELWSAPGEGADREGDEQ
jgi:hypothetical protein